ncbi:MAG: TetR/AcrR family transcriptional regulator [Pseudomonadota bacterium]
MFESHSNTADTQGKSASAAQVESRILEAATTQFLKTGYARTSTAAIARTAGVDRRTVLELFGDKEALFRLIIDREAERTRAPVADGVPMFATAMEAVQFLADHRRDIMKTTIIADLGRIVAHEARENPEIADVFRTYDGREQSQALCEHVFTEWIAHGLFRPFDVPIATRQFHGMLNQAFLFEPRIIGRDIDNLDDYLQSCCEWFCKEYAA